MNTNKLLNKNSTLMLHGLAILMMVYHHMFVGGSTWYVDSPKSIFDFLNFISIGQADTFQVNLAWFCKICVAIYAFTSGVGMFINLEKNNKEELNLLTMYKYCLRRLLNFYLKFFIAFSIFTALQYFAGDLEGYSFLSFDFLKTILGFTASLNGTYWYIAVYYVMVLVSPLAYCLLKEFKFKHYLIVIGAFVVICLIYLFTGNIKEVSKFIQQYQTIYLLIFLEGMFVARFDLADLVGSKLNGLTSLILIIIIYLLRSLLIRAPSDSLFDLVLTFPFVVSWAKLFEKSKYLSSFLIYMGKYSAYIWYSHAYFYAYLFYGIVIKADLSLFTYVQVMFYSLISGIIFTSIEKTVKNLLKI